MDPSQSVDAIRSESGATVRRLCVFRSTRFDTASRSPHLGGIRRSYRGKHVANCGALSDFATAERFQKPVPHRLAQPYGTVEAVLGQDFRGKFVGISLRCANVGGTAPTISRPRRFRERRTSRTSRWHSSEATNRDCFSGSPRRRRWRVIRRPRRFPTARRPSAATATYKAPTRRSIAPAQIALWSPLVSQCLVSGGSLSYRPFSYRPFLLPKPSPLLHGSPLESSGPSSKWLQGPLVLAFLPQIDRKGNSTIFSATSNEGLSYPVFRGNRCNVYSRCIGKSNCKSRFDVSKFRLGRKDASLRSRFPLASPRPMQNERCR